MKLVIIVTTALIVPGGLIILAVTFGRRLIAPPRPSASQNAVAA